MQLLEGESLDKITVRDIVEECEINRNTFYYHYSDIYDLLDDVFRVETEKFMSEDVDENTTFGEEYERAARFVLSTKRQSFTYMTLKSVMFCKTIWRLLHSPLSADS